MLYLSLSISAPICLCLCFFFCSAAFSLSFSRKHCRLLVQNEFLDVNYCFHTVHVGVVDTSHLIDKSSSSFFFFLSFVVTLTVDAGSKDITKQPILNGERCYWRTKRDERSKKRQHYRVKREREAGEKKFIFICLYCSFFH